MQRYGKKAKLTNKNLFLGFLGRFLLDLIFGNTCFTAFYKVAHEASKNNRHHK